MSQKESDESFEIVTDEEGEVVRVFSLPYGESPFAPVKDATNKGTGVPETEDNVGGKTP